MDAIFVNTILSGIQQRNLEASNSAYAVFFFFFGCLRKLELICPTLKFICGKQKNGIDFYISVLCGRKFWENQSWTVWVL